MMNYTQKRTAPILVTLGSKRARRVIAVRQFPAYFAILSVILLSSCSTAQKPNYQQATESDLVQARVSAGLLRQLDSGDLDQARKLALLPVYMGMDGARFESINGLLSLTPEEKKSWEIIAQETLHYLLRHPEACNWDDLSFQAGVRGLRFFLSGPADVQGLNELLERRQKAKP